MPLELVVRTIFSELFVDIVRQMEIGQSASSKYSGLTIHDFRLQKNIALPRLFLDHAQKYMKEYSVIYVSIMRHFQQNAQELKVSDT